jgi:phage terminase small subunit
MGRHGPPAKSRHLCVVESNRGYAQLVVDPSFGVPPPTWLDQEARAEWERIAPDMWRIAKLACGLGLSPLARAHLPLPEKQDDALHGWWPEEPSTH